MTEKELIQKKFKILDLLFEVDCYEVSQFFDVDSDKMLDDKIEVLTALKNGKTIAEIPKFYKVLELMPKGEGEIWD